MPSKECFMKKLTLLALMGLSLPMVASATGATASAAADVKSAQAEKAAAAVAVPRPIHEDQNGPLSCEGRLITAKTLLHLLPQTPGALQGGVQAWLAGHQEFVHGKLLDYDRMTKDTPARIALRDEIHAYLATQGCPTLAKGANYVFAPIPGWLIKMAGYPNRRENIVSRVGKPYGTALTDADYEKLGKELADDQFDSKMVDGKLVLQKPHAPKTFQGMTRLAMYLLAKKAIENDSEIAAHITVPTKYAVHIPGRPEEVSDRNYVTVAQRLEVQDVGAFTPAERAAVLKFLGHCPMVFPNTENIKRLRDGKVAFVDLETRNIWWNFFYQPITGVSRFQQDVDYARDEFNKAFPAAAAAQTAQK
jgi:hypothetical protein